MTIKICERCGRQKEHYAKGLCISCYSYLTILKKPERYKKRLEQNKEWRKRNPNYFKTPKWRKYMREWWRKKHNIPPEKWRIKDENVLTQK